MAVSSKKLRYLTTRPYVEQTVTNLELVSDRTAFIGIMIFTVQVIVDLVFIDIIEVLKEKTTLKRMKHIRLLE